MARADGLTIWQAGRQGPPLRVALSLFVLLVITTTALARSGDNVCVGSGSQPCQPGVGAGAKYSFSENSVSPTLQLFVESGAASWSDGLTGGSDALRQLVGLARKSVPHLQLRVHVYHGNTFSSTALDPSYDEAADTVSLSRVPTLGGADEGKVGFSSPPRPQAVAALDALLKGVSEAQSYAESQVSLEGGQPALDAIGCVVVVITGPRSQDTLVQEEQLHNVIAGRIDELKKSRNNLAQCQLYVILDGADVGLTRWLGHPRFANTYDDGRAFNVAMTLHDIQQSDSDGAKTSTQAALLHHGIHMRLIDWGNATTLGWVRDAVEHLSTAEPPSRRHKPVRSSGTVEMMTSSPQPQLEDGQKRWTSQHLVKKPIPVMVRLGGATLLSPALAC